MYVSRVIQNLGNGMKKTEKSEVEREISSQRRQIDRHIVDVEQGIIMTKLEKKQDDS
jgi:hypothetical protein